MQTSYYNLNFCIVILCNSIYHLRNKLKDICFSTLNSYNFDKVNTNFTESESKALKELIRRKDLVIQKADKGNTADITDRENYLKGIKSLLSHNTKFMPLNIDQNKWLNYIVNLEKKLKEHFKTSEREKTKYPRMSLKVFALSAHALVFCMVNLKSTKLCLIAFLNFDQFYRLLTHLYIN